MTQTIARSISKPIQGWLLHRHSVARVLFVGQRACNLLVGQDDVISLVDSQVGDGPFNIVLRDLSSVPIGVQTDCRMRLGREWLWLDGFGIDLREASVWDPSPDWNVLRKGRTQVHASLPVLHDLCTRRATASLFAPLLGLPAPDGGLASIAFRRARNALQDLRAGWAGDRRRLRRAAISLAGLGIGLTPSGDDLLVGIMLWAWLAHPAPGQFCRTLLEASAPRTTALSAAFLRAAARGQCSAPWHALLTALLTTEKAQIVAAVHEILRHGATSGADALIGFLCFSSIGDARAHEMSHQA